MCYLKFSTSQQMLTFILFSFKIFVLLLFLDR